MAEAAPAMLITAAIATIATVVGMRWSSLEEHDAGQHEAARLAQREDAERHPAQVPVGATQERRDEQLGRAERVREDADDRGRGDRGSQREQERDREAVPGQREDGSRGRPDPVERPKAPLAERSPLVDRGPRAGRDAEPAERRHPPPPDAFTEVGGSGAGVGAARLARECLGAPGYGSRAAAGSRPRQAPARDGAASVDQSIVIVSPLSSSSRMSTMGPRRPVLSASRTRSA